MICIASTICVFYIITFTNAIDFEFEAHFVTPQKPTFKYKIENEQHMKPILRMPNSREGQISELIANPQELLTQQQLWLQQQLETLQKYNLGMLMSKYPVQQTTTTQSEHKNKNTSKHRPDENKNLFDYDRPHRYVVEEADFIKSEESIEQEPKPKTKHKQHLLDEQEQKAVEPSITGNIGFATEVIEAYPAKKYKSEEKTVETNPATIEPLEFTVTTEFSNPTEHEDPIKSIEPVDLVKPTATIEPPQNKEMTAETTTENIFNTMSEKDLNTEIFESEAVPHQIKYNLEIKTFTLQILASGLKVFNEMKNKAPDLSIRTKLDTLAKSYEYKYREFLRETYKQNIKTRLGTQKVLLNAIDVSDRILKRLVNEVVVDMDKKGALRGNIAAVNDFQHVVYKETDHQFQTLCTKIGICRSGDGFSEFLNDFLTTILSCNDDKFKLAIDSFTDVAKDVDFKNTFHKKTRKEIKKSIDNVERKDIEELRPSLMVIRNIIANKNRPIVVKPADLEDSSVNSTIALLEILEAFEIKLPRSDANILEWGDLRTSIHEWEKGRRNDIQDIMGIFIKHLKTALDGMSGSMQDHVALNFSRFVKSE